MNFTYEDYLAIKEIIAKKALSLMSSEKKQYTQIGFPIQNTLILPSGNRTFYIVSDNVFSEIIFGNVLLEATRQHPELFGTNNPYDVIEAVYRVNPTGELDKFAKFLESEKFCYVLEKSNGQFDERILRLDLFRHIKPNNADGHDFVGGLLHAYRHFSVDGVPLSSGTEINDIADPTQLIIQICIAFFSVNGMIRKSKNYSAFLEISNKYNVRFEFFFEVEIGVYFLNSAWKEEK